ncbi:hypothetical protein JTE90_017071 [Oedothorax gibbosus]|uniref:Uncharacterized protein n=1 Tax=Oedothorax gibbosus TaxID=931172 RepID=A0AAV6UN42_9ARAC|nr:hypothetical protein JTE90_017071 [Oedothorax gibbosus]
MKQLQNNNPTIEETSFEEINELRHGELEKAKLLLLKDSGEGDPSQEEQDWDEETSSEVTRDFGYEELGEGSSSWTSSSCSEELYPSSSQSSMERQETSFSESTNIGKNIYVADQMPTGTQVPREIEDSRSSVEMSLGKRLDLQLEKSVHEVFVTSTPTSDQNIIDDSEPITSFIDCDIIQVMDMLLDQVETEMTNPTKDVLPDNEGKDDINIFKETKNNSKVLKLEGRPEHPADLK